MSGSPTVRGPTHAPTHSNDHDNRMKIEPTTRDTNTTTQITLTTTTTNTDNENANTPQQQQQQHSPAKSDNQVSDNSQRSDSKFGPNRGPTNQNTTSAVNNTPPPSPQGSATEKPKACCFCWCCCCSCSWGTSTRMAQRTTTNKPTDNCRGRQHWIPRLPVKREENKTQSKDRDKDSKGDSNSEKDLEPTLEDIKTWMESFDKLMSSPSGRKKFREFLKMEYSEENMLFYLSCEELKKEENPEMVEEKARLIYEDYISILSPKEVSLDSRVREIINRNMVEPTPNTFDDAQLQIYTLMHRDSYPRFLKSQFFKQLVQQVS